MSTFIDTLSKEEKEVFLNVINGVKVEKEELTKWRQVREIIPWSKWCESEYYVGKDGQRLYDYWKDAGCDVFNNPSGTNQVVLSGSIGTGKSTSALYMMAYKLYQISCYSNPLALFNLMSTSSLVFIYFSLSKSQAELTGYGQFRSIIDSIPYFRDHFPRNDRLQSLLVFPEKVIFTHGSETGHAIGMNMIGSILDEANFFQGETSDASKAITGQAFSKITELYSSVVNRAKSRFMSKEKDHSLSFLVSSATHASSFTEKIIKESANDPHTKVFSPRLWEVKPKGTYSDKRFYVFVGNDSLDATVVESVTDINNVLDIRQMPHTKEDSIDKAMATLPESVKHEFIDVPVDFRKSFQVNVVQALQDIGGYSVAPTGRLFSSKPTYNKSLDMDGDYCSHPFTKETICLPTKSNIQAYQFLKKGFRFIDPDKPHFIHIDQSVTTDDTGIAMSHIDRFEKDEVLEIYKPIIVNDFKLRVTPPKPPQKISISKVVDFMFYLRDVMGVNIHLITYDCYASQMARQILEEGDFNVDYQSVDRTDEAYLTYCELLYEERIIQYAYSPFEEEFFSLLHDRVRKKVDHPPVRLGGKKDISDGVVGSVMSAIKYATQMQSSTAIQSNIKNYTDYQADSEWFEFDDLASDYEF